MATVIDALVVTLGSDPSSVERGLSGLEAALRASGAFHPAAASLIPLLLPGFDAPAGAPVCAATGKEAPSAPSAAPADPAGPAAVGRGKRIAGTLAATLGQRLGADEEAIRLAVAGLAAGRGALAAPGARAESRRPARSGSEARRPEMPGEPGTASAHAAAPAPDAAHAAGKGEIPILAGIAGRLRVFFGPRDAGSLSAPLEAGEGESPAASGAARDEPPGATRDAGGGFGAARELLATAGAAALAALDAERVFTAAGGVAAAAGSFPVGAGAAMPALALSFAAFGGPGGRIETRIDRIDIHTAATDAAGLARDLRDELAGLFNARDLTVATSTGVMIK